jgi:hypothetical protein
MLLGIPGDNTYSNYAEANRALYRQTVLPLLTRIASALGHWLGESFGSDLRLVPDLDEVPALSFEREALWKRVGEASFLTDDEKRAATGYEPLPASSVIPSSAATLLAKYDPNQPRVPGGNPDGGQWTGGGAAGSAANADEGRVLTDANPDELVPGAQYAQSRTRGVGPGPYAAESIPAEGPGRNHSQEVRTGINRIGRLTGCHDCGTLNPGTKSGNFIADHQKPNAINRPGVAQRLYPHCQICSNRQGGWLRWDWVR